MRKRVQIVSINAMPQFIDAFLAGKPGLDRVTVEMVQSLASMALSLGHDVESLLVDREGHLKLIKTHQEVEEVLLGQVES